MPFQKRDLLIDVFASPPFQEPSNHRQYSIPDERLPPISLISLLLSGHLVL
jgi:hypothetical protein